MSSYFNRRTVGSPDLPRPRISSGYHSVGVPVPFTLPDTSKKRDKSQHGQGQSCQLSVTAQGPAQHGHNPVDGSSPPPEHTCNNPSFCCPRCGHPFVSQAELDRHSFACGAASLLTGMFTPFAVQQNEQHQQLQSPSPTPRDAGGYHQPHHKHHHTSMRF